MDLPLDQHVVEDSPAVVDSYMADEMRLSSLDIHLDDCDMAPEGKGLVVLLEIKPRDKGRLRGQVRPPQRGGRHALDAKASIRHEDDILTVGLQPTRRLLPCHVDKRNARSSHGAAAELERPRSRRPRPPGHRAGVRLHDSNAVNRNTEKHRCQLGVSGLVPLPAGGGTYRYHYRAIRLRARLSELRGVEHRGHLDVRAQANAELHAVATLAPRTLFASQLLITRRLQREVERSHVVTSVIGELGGSRVREWAADQVAPPQLGRIQTQLHREHVHRPLDQCYRLGATGATVRGHDSGVGVDAAAAPPDPRDGIHARGKQCRKDQLRRSQARVSSGIRHHVRLQADQLAIGGGTQRNVLDLAAPMGHRQHVLAAVLKPAHRAFELFRDCGDHALLGIGHELGAESAAHVAGDDSHARLRKAECVGNCAADAERHLGRSPHANAALSIGLRHHRVGLDRDCRESLIYESRPDDHGSAFQRAILSQVELEGEVVALVGVNQHRTCLERDSDIDERRQDLVVDNHRGRRVDSLFSRGRDCHGDGIADEFHLVRAESRARGLR